MAADYHFVTLWRLSGSRDGVAAVLRDRSTCRRRRSSPSCGWFAAAVLSGARNQGSEHTNRASPLHLLDETLPAAAPVGPLKLAHRSTAPAPRLDQDHLAAELARRHLAKRLVGLFHGMRRPDQRLQPAGCAELDEPAQLGKRPHA